MTGFILPPGARVVVKAGEWKARREVARQRQARKEADAEGSRLRDRMIDRSTWGAALANAKARREVAEAQVTKVAGRIASLERQALEDPRMFHLIAPARAELEVVTDLLGRIRATEDAERVKLEARIAEAAAQDAAEQAAAEQDADR